MADALVDVCRFFLDNQQGRTTGRNFPHVNILTTAEDLARHRGGTFIEGGSLGFACGSCRLRVRPTAAGLARYGRQRPDLLGATPRRTGAHLTGWRTTGRVSAPVEPHDWRRSDEARQHHREGRGQRVAPMGLRALPDEPARTVAVARTSRGQDPLPENRPLPNGTTRTTRPPGTLDFAA